MEFWLQRLMIPLRSSGGRRHKEPCWMTVQSEVRSREPLGAMLVVVDAMCALLDVDGMISVMPMG